MKIKMIICLGVLATVGLCGCGKKEAVHVRESYAADKISAVSIKNDAWQLEISDSFDGDVHVDLDGRVGEEAGEPKIAVQEGVLEIAMAREEKAGIGRFAFGKEGKMAVSIPEGMDVPVTIVNGPGDLKIARIAATDLTLENASGYLDLEQVTAERLKISSGSGDVRVSEGALRELTISTSSGYVTLKDVKTEEISVDCGSGEIDISGLGADTDAEVSTGSGDIGIAYETEPRDLSFEIASGSEDVTVKWVEASYTMDTPARKKGVAGEGRHCLRVDSDSGTVVVR